MLPGKCKGGKKERYEGHTKYGHKENLDKPKYEVLVFEIGTFIVVAFILSPPAVSSNLNRVFAMINLVASLTELPKT